MKINILKSWIVPLTIALGLFFLIRPVLAQTLEVPENVQVGQQVISGFLQIYYVNGESRIFISSENQNSKEAHSRGKFITWVTEIDDGGGQIFLYDLSSSTKTQITFSGINLNPKVDEKGRVVWEGRGAGETNWQIYFFDGKSIERLTDGDLSLNPEISGDFIVYGRRNVSGTWTATLYSILEKRTIDISIGENARNPQIRDRKIYLAAGTGAEEEFPLTVDDLLLLDLNSLSATTSATSSATLAPEPILETVTQEEIAEELKATPSASPIESGIQESSSSGQLEVQ
jgi:hypothetical protein